MLYNTDFLKFGILKTITQLCRNRVFKKRPIISALKLKCSVLR